MKKLLPLALLMMCSMASQAQVSFSIITNPCNNNGVLSAAFTGLTPPLTVTWTTQGTTGTSIIHTGVSGLSDVLTGYSGGPLTVTAQDALGGTNTGSYAGDPPFTLCGITVSAGICPAPDTLVDTVCSRGTAPFTYQWYNYTTSGFTGTVNPITVIPGNTYGITVTDAAGCTYGALVDPGQTAFAYQLSAFAANVSTTVANCTDGTATVSVTGGGVPPYSYLWTTGASTPTIGSLVMGTYGVTVTDALGCPATSFGSVSQSIIITAPVTPTPATCQYANGSVTAVGTGGTPPYSYVWSNGATTQSQTGLTGGNYTVTITDANGCIGSGGSFVGVSTPIAVTYTTTPSLCTTANGTATLAPAGGTPPYSYSWYTTPYQTGITATGLTYGTYSYQVTDATGCVQEGTVYIPPTDILSVSFLSTPALCTLSNGSLTAYPTGGISPYTYSWNTGATTSSITGKPAGMYEVTITDHVGCKTTEYPVLPDNSPVGAGTVVTPASCLYTNDGIDSANAWGGTPPYSYAWSTGGTTRTISALPTGPYWVSVTDAAGCTFNGLYSYVPYDSTTTSCYCTIEGTVFNDANANCIQDAGETGIPDIQIHIAGGPLSNVYVYTDASGHYSYKVPSGSYTVSETVLPYYPLQSCQTNNIAVSVSAGAGCYNTVNFADSMDTVHDMHISTWDYYYPNNPVGNAVTGPTYTQAVIVTNNGTVTEDSVHVGYKPDGQILGPSFVPGGYFDGSPYWYPTDSVPAMAPGTSQQFLVNYTVPTNIPINTPLAFLDTVVYKGSDSTWVADYSPWNNVDSFSTVTAVSFNPNFKEVYPKGTGAAGLIPNTDSVLEYMVHFQNTGSWQAENVTVVDTLDPNLNWATLNPVFQSAQCKVSLTQSGTRKIATFVFTDIDLPTASSDAVRSNGMFTYTIHMNPGLPSGTQIKNRASIYFDYNAPIMTNSTLNTIISSGSGGVSVKNVPAASNNSFTIYPNPADNTFNAIINSNNGTTGTLVVTDVSGRTLIRRPVVIQNNVQTIPVDATELTSGMYFVSFNSNGTVQTQKLVILKQ